MKTARARFLSEYPDSLRDDAAAVFVGAGMSMGAGYPSWAALLKDIGEELGVGSSDVQDLAALAQWSIQESGSATRVRNVIKAQIGQDHPIPASLEVIARPQTSSRFTAGNATTPQGRRHVELWS